jgi:hypothetical protein
VRDVKEASVAAYESETTTVGAQEVEGASTPYVSETTMVGVGEVEHIREGVGDLG